MPPGKFPHFPKLRNWGNLLVVVSTVVLSYIASSAVAQQLDKRLKRALDMDNEEKNLERSRMELVGNEFRYLPGMINNMLTRHNLTPSTPLFDNYRR